MPKQPDAQQTQKREASIFAPPADPPATPRTYAESLTLIQLQKLLEPASRVPAPAYLDPEEARHFANLRKRLTGNQCSFIVHRLYKTCTTAIQAVEASSYVTKNPRQVASVISKVPHVSRLCAYMRGAGAYSPISAWQADEDEKKAARAAARTARAELKNVKGEGVAELKHKSEALVVLLPGGEVQEILSQDQAEGLLSLQASATAADAVELERRLLAGESLGKLGLVVQEWCMTETRDGGHVMKIKLADRQKAIKQLSQMKGWKPKSQDKGAGSGNVFQMFLNSIDGESARPTSQISGQSQNAMDAVDVTPLEPVADNGETRIP